MRCAYIRKNVAFINNDLTRNTKGTAFIDFRYICKQRNFKYICHSVNLHETLAFLVVSIDMHWVLLKSRLWIWNHIASKDSSNPPQFDVA